MVKEKLDNQYLSYVLEDNTKFFPTGYRVLKKQKSKGYIPCSKINYNGHIKLLYPIGNYISVCNAAEEWNTEQVYEWILKIIKSLIEIRDNGFLRIEDVDFELSHIFIDEENETVHLVVLPLTSDANNMIHVHWEDELKKTLISIVEISKMRDAQKSDEIKNIISNNSESLDLLYQEIQKVNIHTQTTSATGKLTSKDKKIVEIPKGQLHIVAKNSLKMVDIAITKDAFVLGKNPNLSDGVLNMSPTISRQHCKITKQKGCYYIEDLDSLNHTFVNGEVLESGKRVMIQAGMQIQLAEVEFKAEFRD